MESAALPQLDAELAAVAASLAASPAQGATGTWTASLPLHLKRDFDDGSKTIVGGREQGAENNPSAKFDSQPKGSTSTPATGAGAGEAGDG